jgi:uncharacterized membrane protein YjgN (DUF898 family)
MAPTLYDVVFRGKILPGFDFTAVKAKLMDMFSLSEDKAAKILKSSRMVLKKGVDEVSAKKLGFALKRAGMDVSLVRSKQAPVSEKPSQVPPVEGLATDAKEDPEKVTKKDEGVTAEGGVAAQVSQKADDEVSRVPFNFRGVGSEYFKIWLVNIILSVITLGIYSAWAKVRRKQYFYGSTKLIGSSFEYLADPKKILKGRLIVAGFFIFYSILSSFAPLAATIMSLAFIVILPWLIVRSLTFNARNSAFRNVRFGFKGSIKEAAKVYILWPFAAALTLGILFPYVYYRQKKFVVENTLYGISAFVFTATSREYYRICFSALIPIIIGIVLVAASGFFFPPLSALVFLVLYLYLFAFFSVKTTNILFNTSSLSHHQFEAGLKIREYLMLVITNSLGIAFTLGLFFPWAKVRTARYKLEHVALLKAGDIDGFIADEEKQVSAVGEEMGDFFDMDFGI